MTPLEIGAGVLSVANGTFTLTTSILKLRLVDEDLKTCVQLLCMMDKDINAARILRNRKFPRYRPELVVKGGLLDRTNDAIEDLMFHMRVISQCVEAVRVDKSVDGSISIPHRFQWVFQKKENFLAQATIGREAHQRVLSVITSLENLPDAHSQTLDLPPAYEDLILRSPSQSRTLKGKTSAILVTEERPVGVTRSPSDSPIPEDFTDEDIVILRNLAHLGRCNRVKK